MKRKINIITVWRLFGPSASKSAESGRCGTDNVLQKQCLTDEHADKLEGQSNNLRHSAITISLDREVL